MKAKLFLSGLMVFFCLLSACKKNDSEIQSQKVDDFISKVKSSSTFDNLDYALPDFSDKDIGNLMKYIRDTTEVRVFPTNPISSLYTSPKILNECVMWTIEGIRLKKKYASLQPMLLETSSPFNRLTKIQLIDLAVKYEEWHDEYQKNPSDAVRTKVILDSKYRWY
jgi:hypothetical protein